MNVMKTLWASVQNDASFMRRVNGWLTIFWVVMIPVSYGFGWLDSVTYVSALSLWALVSGHWSAWQAARVEVRQEAEIKAAADKDLAGEVVERLVDETDVEATTPLRGVAAVAATGSTRAGATVGALPHPCPTCGHAA